jgi:hypothetical protein
MSQPFVRLRISTKFLAIDTPIFAATIEAIAFATLERSIGCRGFAIFRFYLLVFSDAISNVFVEVADLKTRYYNYILGLITLNADDLQNCKYFINKESLTHCEHLLSGF